jgi:protein TonB
MNTMQLSTASLDDIVFEGRNQSYGAYVLRRIYNRHLVTGLTISVSLCLLLVAVPFVVEKVWPTTVVVPEIPVDVFIEPQVYDLDHKPTPPPAPQRREVVVARPADQVPEVVKDELVKPTPEAKPMRDAEPGEITGPVAIPGSKEIGIAGPPTTGGSDSSATASPAPAAPFIHVEFMPEFAGGQDALRQYLQRNLRYPRQALAEGISGKVFVAFTVQSSGIISDVQVLKGMGYGTDEEAARVIKAMPAWTPGRQNNHPVAVRYTLPITFRYE